MVRRSVVLARSDGTDLRTGTRTFAGEVEAPPDAPFPLVTSAVHLIEVGGLDDENGMHRPWRAFEVEASEIDYDDEMSMTLGFGQQVAKRSRVLRELTMDEALGFAVDEHARRVLDRVVGLRRTPWFVPPISPPIGPADTPIVEVASLAHARDLLATLAEQPDKRFDLLRRELPTVRADTTNLARVRAICEPVVAEITALGADIDQDTPEDLSRLPFSAAHFVVGHLSWQLVDPILAAAPRPLVNPFAPLAELVLLGYVPLGWDGGSLAVYAPGRARS